MAVKPGGGVSQRAQSILGLHARSFMMQRGIAVSIVSGRGPWPWTDTARQENSHTPFGMVDALLFHWCQSCCGSDTRVNVPVFAAISHDGVQWWNRNDSAFAVRAETRTQTRTRTRPSSGTDVRAAVMRRRRQRTPNFVRGVRAEKDNPELNPKLVVRARQIVHQLLDHRR